MKSFKFKIPASTANLGPGFDVLGIALSLYLEIQVELVTDSSGINIICHGEGKDEISLDPSKNLITKTALYVAKACNTQLPSMTVTCFNQIPLGSGLGSSGTAVVAGVCLANAACDLGLSKERLLDYCLYIEGHPDNVSPSLLGGFVTAYMRSSFLEEAAVLSDHSCTFPPEEPVGKFVQLPISSNIKAIAVTPDFQLPTVKARECVPKTFNRSDVIFNLQRVAVLVSALGQAEPDAFIISEAMQDKMHQQYRQHLIPGLPEVLGLTPAKINGLLGVALSGAGPTVLILANGNFGEISKKVQDIFANYKGLNGQPIKSTARLLEIDMKGAVLE